MRYENLPEELDDPDWYRSQFILADNADPNLTPEKRMLLAELYQQAYTDNDLVEDLNFERVEKQTGLAKVQVQELLKELHRDGYIDGAGDMKIAVVDDDGERTHRVVMFTVGGVLSAAAKRHPQREQFRSLYRYWTLGRDFEDGL